MDSFELNKIMGALLFSVLIVITLSNLSGILYHVDKPEKPGYVIEVAEVSTGGNTPKADVPEVEPIAVRLASADAGKGVKVAKKCISCHTFDKDGANKTGPNLWNLVDRAPGAVSSFGYSDAMKEFAAGKAWNFETLDAFLTKPKKLVAKTSMSFPGLKKPGDRANLIAYIREQADSPVPVPAAEPATETAAEEPAAE